MNDALICCRRCEQWKDPSQFHRDAALPESRVVCRDCFPRWLDEQGQRLDEHDQRGRNE